MASDLSIKISIPCENEWMEVSKMRFSSVLLLMAVVCLVSAASAAPPKQIVEPTDVPVDLSSGNMQIASTEHTAEYLAKTGGTAQPSPEGSYRNVAGNWTFELRDLRSRPIGNIDLQIFQYGGTLFGKGVLRNGLREQPATADGALVEGNTMTLNVISLEDTNLYVLSINIDDSNITSGSFKMFTPAGGEPLTGSIYGGRNEPRTFS